ncbi:MAG: glycosyltransferase [Candidatus Moranbacteria bacterium]|jgi:GT2 family glycosyltransferase/glycosyltransferase involved in cell wall biosynthesis|nr:glycosyltransferase [Candidatus Moranbacteria bacterium]
MKKLSAIITPTWNNEDYTIRCFDSIRKNTKDYKIIWIDNGSEKESREKVKKFLDENNVPYELIQNEENLGFVKATNQGMKRAMELGAKYIVLENNDTEVYDGWLDRMIEVAESDPKVGLVGPITSPCDSWQSVDNLRKSHNEFSDLPEYKNNPEEYSQLIKDKYRGSVVESKIQIAFFSALIKKDVVEKIGFLSEEFGVGFGDDDDYCIRAMKEGWKIFLAKDVFVFHNHRTTFKSIYSADEIKGMLNENKHKYKTKHDEFLNNEKIDLPGYDKNKQILVTFISHSGGISGGSEKSLLELIDGLTARNFYCTVIIPNRGFMEEELKKRGTYYEVAPFRWWTVKDSGEKNSVHEELIDSLANVFISLKRINPDVVYSNTSVINAGALASKILGKPHIWHIREFGEKDHGLNFIYDFPKRARYIKENSDHIIFNSNAVKNYYCNHIGSENTAIACNNVPAPKSGKKIKNMFLRSSSFKMAIIGVIQEGKGQKDAVLATGGLIKEGYDVELILAGNVEEKYGKEISNFIEENNLKENVRFLGYVKNTADLIKEADLGLVCSKNEAFGRVAVEFMLASKPIIGTNTGGTAELVREGVNGFLYSPGNVEELKEKIKILLNNKEKIKEMGNAGLDFARENFSDEKYSGKIAEIIKKACKDKENKNKSGVDYENLIMQTMKRIVRLSEDNKMKEEINNLDKQEIEMMRNSKFWKLRNIYVYLKNGIKFALFSPGKFLRKYLKK